MMFQPMTVEDAKSKYESSGRPYDESRCAAKVSDPSGWHFYQCKRKNGKGPNGPYCGIHAKKITAPTGGKEAK
jgi:hypothetical protein